MGFYAESINLPESVFWLLRELIHERTGLLYENDKRELLADRLAPLVLERGFQSALDYYYLLKYDPQADLEWRRVMDVLSVQETYFWREVDQLHALVNRVVPSYFEQPQHDLLRITVTACATGEEPLSIAIMLNEAGWFDRKQIEIYAADASSKALEKARAGLYRERSFRNLPAHLRLKYFTEEAGGWRVDKRLHQRIRWSQVNLLAAEDMATLLPSPVIFCRNVFIYFSQDAIQKTVARFAAMMPERGYLFVGSSESLLRLSTVFELEEIGGAFVYVKK